MDQIIALARKSTPVFPVDAVRAAIVAFCALALIFAKAALPF